jgi:hypothetical protein
MPTHLTPIEDRAVFVLPDEGRQIEVRIESDTVWLTQRQMADLFDTSTDNVGLHLKNIYVDQELMETATTEDFSVVQREGRRNVKRQTKHYNLDAVIKNRRPLLEQNALVALALLVAESDPKHKDVVVRLITSLMQPATEPIP